MNEYGARAQRTWQRSDPARYAELDDPESFFESLGDQVLIRVDQIASVMEREIPQDLPYLERVGQLSAVRNQAAEIALNELVTIDVHPATVDEEMDLLDSERPSEMQIRRLLARLEDREPEMATDEYEEELARILALRNPL